MTDDNKIYLLDENGNERGFELVASFDIEDAHYALLAENEESDDVFPFRIEEDENGEMTLMPVEDEAEFQLISDTYDQLMEEDETEHVHDENCDCGHHHE